MAYPKFLRRFFWRVATLNVGGCPYTVSMNEKQLKALMAQIVRANAIRLEAEKKLTK